MFNSKSVFVIFCVVSTALADVSHLKDSDNIVNEKIAVPLFTKNEFPQVPSIALIEPAKPIEVLPILTDDVTTVVPEIEEVDATTVQVSEEETVPVVAVSAKLEATGRNLDLTEVDPGFSRPIISNFPALNLPRNLAEQYDFKSASLDNEYLPPNEVNNEYLPPDNEYLPPQARNQQVVVATKTEDESVAEQKVEEVAVTEEAVIVPTTQFEQRRIAKVQSANLKNSNVEVLGSDSVVVTKQGNTPRDEVIVRHQTQVPQKIEVIPSSGYFYPKPRILFLYRK